MRAMLHRHVRSCPALLAVLSFMLVSRAAPADAADPFLGVWNADVQKDAQSLGMAKEMKEALKNLPPGTAVGLSIRVEAYKSGYKLTYVSGAYSWIVTVDFATGATAVRDGEGHEIGRVKLVRKSPVEIEATHLDNGVVEDYRILPSGNDLEVTLVDKEDKAHWTLHYKRAA